MSINNLNPPLGEYDPDLPNASAVLVSLSCVAMRYAKAPSEALANLGCQLAQTLTAPEYAESELVVLAAQQLCWQWQSLLAEHQYYALQQRAECLPQSTTVQ